MPPDQILAFVLALTSPQPSAPLFPVIAAGGADPRYPVVAAPCPRPSRPTRSRAKPSPAARSTCPRIMTSPMVAGST
jgi:hypothetical protein